MSEPPRTRVAVVGGGLSGLAAARRLREHGIEDVTVLEARAHVGGRSWRELVDGVVISRGGAWTGPSQRDVVELAAACGVATFPSVKHADAEELHVRGDGPVFRGPSAAEAPAARPREVAAVYAAFSEIADAVDPERPWESPQARELDALTARAWVAGQTEDPLVRELAEELFVRPLGLSPAEVSMLALAAYFAGAGGVEQHDRDTTPERFIGGAGLISERIAEELDERVRRDWPVLEIAWADGGATVRGPRGELRAERVVVAMSPADARRIHFAPSLPRARRLLQERSFGAAMLKTSLVYDEPFWWDDGLSGRALVDGPSGIGVRDDSPPDGSVGILIAIGYPSAGTAGIGLERERFDDAEARNAALLRTVERLFGPRAAHPRMVVETDWADQRWVCGCLGLVQPGILSTCGDALRTPVGPLHWAGTETATRWPNHLNGAVQAGHRAADEVAAAL